MLQLAILSGKMAGAQAVARHFPFRIGRAPAADLRLEEDGIWEQHLEINLNPAEGFLLTVQPNALAAINGQRVEQALLRNGDVIELGAVRLHFGLSGTRQRGLRVRELLTWIALGALCLSQVFLIYKLLE